MRYERSFQDALQVAQKRGTRAALMQEKKLLKLVRAKEDEIRFQALETIFFGTAKETSFYQEQEAPIRFPLHAKN